MTKSVTTAVDCRARRPQTIGDARPWLAPKPDGTAQPVLRFTDPRGATQRLALNRHQLTRISDGTDPFLTGPRNHRALVRPGRYRDTRGGLMNSRGSTRARRALHACVIREEPNAGHDSPDAPALAREPATSSQIHPPGLTILAPSRRPGCPERGSGRRCGRRQHLSGADFDIRQLHREFTGQSHKLWPVPFLQHYRLSIRRLGRPLRSHATSSA